jgi:GT2 family glycosyltransferase
MITIGISISDHFTTPWLFTKSLVGFISRYPDNKILTAHGSLIHDNRNYLYEKCQDDFLLMIDTDIVFDKEDPYRLFETMALTGADICTGVYREGYPPNNYALFDEKFEHPKTLKKKPFEVHACGCGFILINLKKVRLGEKPFDPIIDAEVRHGEDISFCVRARNKGYKIVCDPNVKVGHLRLKEICV